MKKDPQLRLLPWDTDFLGFSTGQLTASALSANALQAVLVRARRQRWRLVYWAIDPLDAASCASARQLGGVLADEQVLYQRAVLPPEAAGCSDPHVQQLRELTPEVVELAQQSSAFSRFHADAQFASGVCEALYAHWIRNSVSGVEGQQVFGYTAAPAGPLLGLITLEDKPEGAFIGLLAVQSSARGKGIGKKLLERCCQELAARGIGLLTVATQAANTAACAFYQQSGFVEVQRRYRYHFWL